MSHAVSFNEYGETDGLQIVEVEDPSPGAARSEARVGEILDRVRSVPEGFVRTYGDIAPGAPRLAGTVLAGCRDPSVPWHRIVRADGSLAKGERQRALLDREGVPFRGSRVQMRVARMVLPGQAGV
jgi:methylated-DNA-protein-cysteine methyltransferase-like protein